ncbi:MAG TPA: hydrogenase maturation nickel metallochaperone HypA [Cyanobacteria bacterium UBA12227]|nr:hydrogenase maturation nickel metallochaperone HypA [Cyanobacteria bacterium UBA12227]HAX88845.1 hydrogenase maturation nickel metallochaperone HypA [Cyanobacteria bacterium UBA11370]HBY77381.1 hydrogenase maturation nickel metallochaperone HypA [Cyanobacteria bacterium UBA11148]
MHELGITQTIVDTVSEHAKGAKVQRITLEIGKLAAIMPDAVRFCFDVCCRGTVLEGATLEIIEIPGLARCRRCGTQVSLDEPFGICECGSVELDVISGQELKIKEMEVELCA